jgi:hypothetical protein
MRSCWNPNPLHQSFLTRKGIDQPRQRAKYALDLIRSQARRADWQTPEYTRPGHHTMKLIKIVSRNGDKEVARINEPVKIRKHLLASRTKAGEESQQ